MFQGRSGSALLRMRRPDVLHFGVRPDRGRLLLSDGLCGIKGEPGRRSSAFPAHPNFPLLPSSSQSPRCDRPPPGFVDGKHLEIVLSSCVDVFYSSCSTTATAARVSRTSGCMVIPALSSSRRAPAHFYLMTQSARRDCTTPNPQWYVGAPISSELRTLTSNTRCSALAGRTGMERAR